MTHRNRFEADEPLPLDYAVTAQQAPLKQPRLLLVLVPALLVEMALAGYAISRPGDPPVGGAVFAILVVAVLGLVAFHGYPTAKWMLAALWVIRGCVAIGAAIGKHSGPLVYGLGSFYLIMAVTLLLIPTRRGPHPAA